MIKTKLKGLCYGGILLLLLIFFINKYRDFIHESCPEPAKPEYFTKECWDDKSDLTRVFAKRRQTLDKFCTNQKNTSSQVAKASIMTGPMTFFSKKFNFIYCRQGKTGSTSLLSVLEENLGSDNCLTKNSSKHEPSLKPCFRFPPDQAKSSQNSKDLYKTMVSFFFVRHPLIRLVSAFQEKVMPNHRGRYGNSTLIRNRFGPSKEKFDKLRHLTQRVAVFRAFVRAYIAGAYQDMRHFVPLTSRCLVCDLHYRFIGKVETRDEDLSYIYNITGLRDDSNVKKNPSSGGDTEELSKMLYSFISRPELSKLKKSFKNDFLAFNYDHSIFDSLAGTHPEFIKRWR